MTEAFLTPSFSTAYFEAAALSATDTEMNSTALGALLSTGGNGMPPITARSARFQTVKAPGAPTSAPPRMNVGFLSATWPAHRAEVEGWPSVAQVSSCTGRPPMPPLYSLMYLTAASAAWRYSGKVTGPASRLRRPTVIGSPVAFLGVPSAAAASGVALVLVEELSLCFDEDDESSPPQPATSKPVATVTARAAPHLLMTFMCVVSSSMGLVMPPSRRPRRGSSIARAPVARAD